MDVFLDVQPSYYRVTVHPVYLPLSIYLSLALNMHAGDEVTAC
jgi:hypothetical protein